MPLSTEAIDALAGLAGVESSVITSAISSDEETNLEIAEGRISFDPDGLTEFKTNAINEAKPGIQTAALETGAKEIAREFGYDLSGSDKRDFKAVLSFHEAKVLADAKLKPDELKTQYELKLSEKDSLIDDLNNKVTQKESDFEAYKFNSGINTTVLSNLSKEANLSANDRLTLFNAKYQVRTNEAGATEILQDGKVIKDSKLNPLPLADVVKQFDAAYVKSEGRGDGAGDKGNRIPADKIKEQLVARGLKSGTKEYFQEYNKLLNNK
jgi:hypothetical protein